MQDAAIKTDAVTALPPGYLLAEPARWALTPLCSHTHAPMSVCFPSANGLHQGTATHRTSMSLGEQSQEAPSQNRAGQSRACVNRGWGGGSVWGEVKHPPWRRVLQEALVGGSKPGLKTGGGEGREAVGEGYQERAEGEAVGSGRRDSCHTEMASGLTASCERCLRVAVAALWKCTACLQHGLCVRASVHCEGRGETGRLPNAPVSPLQPLPIRPHLP